MATVNKDLAETIAKANGYYADDPRVVRIVEYTNVFGSGQSYGLEYEGQLGKYAASQYVINPMVYWQAQD